MFWILFWSGGQLNSVTFPSNSPILLGMYGGRSPDLLPEVLVWHHKGALQFGSEGASAQTIRGPTCASTAHKDHVRARKMVAE